MIGVDAGTVLVAWAAGGWFFLWVTTRRREVGLGYGWLLRIIFLLLAAASLAAGGVSGSTPAPAAAAATAAFAAVGLVALGVSAARRRAGVAGQRAAAERRSARVAAMTGIKRDRPRFDSAAAEFPPGLDLAAAAAGLVAAVLGAASADGGSVLAMARTLAGALFLGAVTDAMLLGHWYLVQPGLPRAPLLQLVRATGWLWLPETAVMLWPTGMLSVLNGSIDDGYNGLLGWFWAACTVATAALVAVTKAALRERGYAAVMAATGLMYLAIVTAFGQDLVARILLAP